MTSHQQRAVLTHCVSQKDKNEEWKDKLVAQCGVGFGRAQTAAVTKEARHIRNRLRYPFIRKTETRFKNNSFIFKELLNLSTPQEPPQQREVDWIIYRACLSPFHFNKSQGRTAAASPVGRDWTLPLRYQEVAVHLFSNVLLCSNHV